MSYTEVIEQIENLPHYRTFICPRCGHKQQVYTLFIQVDCEECQLRVKLRGYASIGSEIEDVIDAVLAWLGNGKELELAMERKQTVSSSSE